MCMFGVMFGMRSECVAIKYYNRSTWQTFPCVRVRRILENGWFGGGSA